MFFILLAIFCFSFGLTWFLRRYALAKNVLDIPNARSAHSVPTPRGGGLAFVFSILFSIPILNYFSVLTSDGSVALVSAGFFIAFLGFLDDHGHVSSLWRLIGHFFASTLALYWIGGLPTIHIFSWVLPAGVFSNVLTVFYLVWLINLYNFMDGLDGLAAVEAISVCGSMALLYALCGQGSLVIIMLVLMMSIAGFLCWNFPPARIFMGDAGSGFLGFILGVLSIQAGTNALEFFWSWLILLGVFIVDATFTLFRRLVNSEKLYEAHSTHAYQYASRYFNRHLPVTMGVFLINIVWLCPIALCVGLKVLDGFTGLVIAYLPLIFLVTRFNAGKRLQLDQ